jgi:hypothetical protein
MVRKLLTLLAVLAAIASVAVVPAGAITNGTPDGEGHPYVGLMVAKNAAGVPLWRCSGTLMSETIFMVAGHCTEAPAASAVIWFSSDSPSGIPLGTGYPAAGRESVRRDQWLPVHRRRHRCAPVHTPAVRHERVLPA